jgi:hypothetical protein
MLRALSILDFEAIPKHFSLRSRWGDYKMGYLNRLKDTKAWRSTRPITPIVTLTTIRITMSLADPRHAATFFVS